MMQSTRAASRLLLKAQNSPKSVILKPVASQDSKFNTSATRAASSKGPRLAYEGILAPVYTPFTRDGEQLALESIPQYSQYLASKGVKGVLVAGTNGEGMSMNVSERTSVIDAWVAAGQTDNLHIQANVGGTNIKDALHLAKHAESAGVNSLLTLPELYYKPQSVAALVQYIKRIAEAAPSLPILYYHIPSMTNVNYLNLVDFVGQATREIPNFAGMKFTDGDLITGTAVVNLDPERLRIFLGANEVLCGAFLLGFNCAMAAPLNLWPTLCLQLVAAVKAGRVDEAKEKQRQLNSAIYAVTQYGNRFACYKAATEIISGVPLGPTRFPIPALDLKLTEKLRATIKEIGAI